MSSAGRVSADVSANGEVPTSRTPGPRPQRSTIAAVELRLGRLGVLVADEEADLGVPA